MAGRPRTSATKLLAAGSSKGRRRPDPAGPTLLATVPKPPAGIDPEAAATWRTLAPLLVERGSLTQSDLPALRLLCDMTADAASIAATLREQGRVVAAADGTPKPHPLVKQLIDPRAQVMRLAHDFGLTPRAREYVSSSPLAVAAKRASATDFPEI
jgi:P27 family predicted phage terminase small subunit